MMTDVFQCLKAGAFGYWLKSEPLAKVIEAIRDIHAGGASMSCVIARKVLTEFNKPVGNPEVLAALSPRERQILESMAVGHRYKEMAGKLGISYDTVRAHIRRIYEKLHVHSRGEAWRNTIRLAERAPDGSRQTGRAPISNRLGCATGGSWNQSRLQTGAPLESALPALRPVVKIVAAGDDFGQIHTDWKSALRRVNFPRWPRAT